MIILLPSVGHIRKILTSLPKKDVTLFLKNFLHLDTRKPAETLSVRDQLNLYLYEWLMHWGLFKDIQCYALLTAMKPGLQVLIQSIEAQNVQGAQLGHSLSIADQRYAVWHGSSDWFDLHESDFLGNLDIPNNPSSRCVTFIVCNIYRLWQRKQDWLMKLEGNQ